MKIKKLTEADVIRIFREEWQSQMDQINEDSDIDFAIRLPNKSGDSKKKSYDETIVLSPGLKVRHKKSQIRYTVASVDKESCVLKTPEGKNFLVTAKKMEAEYEVD
jgi:hypothetical protein